MQVTAAEC